MKFYFLFAMALSVSLLSCHFKEKNPDLKTPDSTPPFASLFHYGNPRLLEYDRYLAKLDTEKVRMGLVAFRKFQGLFTAQPPEICDTAYYLFDHFQQKLGVSLDRVHDSLNLEPLILSEQDGKQPVRSQKLMAFAHALEENGFRVGEEEGMPFIEQSYYFADLHFSACVSPAMKAWLAQRDKEQKEGFQDDAELVVDPTQLAERAVWWETFVRDHSKFIYCEIARDNFGTLQYVLLNGMDNSPVSDNDSLTSYYREAYIYIGSHFAGSQTNGLIEPYFKAWQRRDTTEIQRIRGLFLKNRSI